MPRGLQPVGEVRTTVRGLGAALLVVLPAAAQPVSYTREVAPILAMNCHGCHGANPESVAGGLSTRTRADLKKGGNLGAVIIPGDPDASPLYQFVSGARGEAHRMPLGGPPLTAAQIGMLRKWILAGAMEDADATRTYRLELPALRLNRSRPVRIAARMPSAGYVELELTDSRDGTLYREGGAVKAAKDSASAGAPGQWITWDLRRATDWPEQVRARLAVKYAEPEPEYVALAAGAAADLPEAEVELRILSENGGNAVLNRREHVRGGLPDFARWKSEVAPGWYVLHLRYTQIPAEAAFLFRSGEASSTR